MASKVTSRLIVIDASIARSAGPENATHPTSKSCRDFLLSVLEVCHRAAFSKELKEGWRKHQSSFARQWMTSMFARKKIDSIESEPDDKLRSLIQKIGKENDRNAMLKDVHLVEAASSADGIVASLDERVRTLFRPRSTGNPWNAFSLQRQEEEPIHCKSFREGIRRRSDGSTCALDE